MKLYHYYEKKIGPFMNLSDLSIEQANLILTEIKLNGKSFASKRPSDYMVIRRELEEVARNMFIEKGGLPVRKAPHYMTLGSCSWLLEWYEEGNEISIPLDYFDEKTISFTYGDLFPTMRFKDDKPYRGKVYTKEEILKVINTYGFPQEWNKDGLYGPERYIEVQIWDDSIIQEQEDNGMLNYMGSRLS